MYVKSSTVLIVIFTILLIFPGYATISFAEDYVLYHAISQGLTLEYPENWIEVDEPAEPILAMFYVEDKFETVSANIIVMQIKLDENISSFEAADEIIDDMANDYSGFRVEQEGEHQINGHESRQKIFSYESDLGRVKQNMVVTVIENSAYIFALSALPEDYTQYLPIFNTVLNSIEISPEIIPQVIDNDYENVELGIKSKFPQNWISLKSVVYDEDGIPMNAITSIHPSIASGDMEDTVMIMLGYSDNESVTSNSHFSSLENSDCYLSNNDVSILEFNEMKVMEFDMTCIPEGFDVELDGLGNIFITQENSIFLIYMATDKQYQDRFEEFETFRDSVRIDGTLDWSDEFAVSSAYDIKIKQEEEKINDGVYVPIILYDDSIIKNFKFDVGNSEISFDPIADKEGFFQADIQVNEIISPAYSVDIEGDYTEYFIISDKTTDEIVVSIYAESPVDTVAIRGYSNSDILKIPNSDSISIPDWIKTNAGWWAAEQIDDGTFISGIQYLIKDGVISVSSIPSSGDTTNEIPGWVKNNANWWSQELIPDTDFIKGIEFLVENGIINVS